MTPLVAFIVVILVAIMVGNLVRRARAGVRSVRSHNRALDTLGHISTQRSNPGASLPSAPAFTHQAHVRIVSPDPPPPPPVEPVFVEEPARAPVPSRLVLPPPPSNDIWDTTTAAVPLVVPEANGHLSGLAVNGNQVDTGGNGLQAASGGLDVLAPDDPRLPASGGPGDGSSGGEGAAGGDDHSPIAGQDDLGKGPPRRRRPFDRGHRRRRDARRNGGDPGGGAESGADGDPGAGAESGGAESGRAESGGAESGGAESNGAGERNGGGDPDRSGLGDRSGPGDRSGLGDHGGDGHPDRDGDRAADGSADRRQAIDLRQPYDLARGAELSFEPGPDGDIGAGGGSFYPAASEGLSPRTFLGRLQPARGPAEPGSAPPEPARTRRPGRAGLVTLSPFSRQRQHRRTVLRRVAAVALLALLVLALVATLDRHHSAPPVAAPVHHRVRPTTPTTRKRATAPPRHVRVVRPARLISDTNGISHYQVPGRARVTFTATGLCWVEVRHADVTGRVLTTRTLTAGATESVTAPAWVRLGSPTAVSIRVGGVRVSDPVPSGEPHDLQFG